MILRRLMSHMKEQNWFAVGLDFLVVVVGIFLGMQVNNWNEDRKQQADIQQKLIELHQEVSDSYKYQERLIFTYIGFLEKIQKAYHIGLKGFQSDADKAAYIEGLAYSGIFAQQIRRHGILDEMMASGEQNLIPDQILRQEIRTYYNLSLMNFRLIEESSKDALKASDRIQQQVNFGPPNNNDISAFNVLPEKPNQALSSDLSRILARWNWSISNMMFIHDETGKVLNSLSRYLHKAPITLHDHSKLDASFYWPGRSEMVNNEEDDK